jgi:murein hydrolase activator
MRRAGLPILPVVLPAALVAALLCGFAPSAQAASDAEDLKSHAKSVEQNLDRERKELLDSELKKRGILGTLYEINKELSRINGDIDSVESQVDNSKKIIESYAKVIVRLEKIRDEEKVKLRDRLRALYKLGLRGYAEVLLSSQTSSEFSRNMKFLKIIAEKDQALITNYKNNLDMLAREQTKLKGQVRVYLAFSADLKKEKLKFDDQKNKQLYILHEIDHDRESHMEAIKEWREAGVKLEEHLTQLGMQSAVSPDVTRAAFFEQKGQLRAPVIEPILQKYGIIKNERFQTKIFHKGLFFAAKAKEKVSAIYWGKVAFAGWLDGYGETIILDHGDHYYSLYAHNYKLQKKFGEVVQSGEPIALAGDTGSLRGPGLYMEIRHFSESLDPLPWLDLGKATRL